jgi:hypothetical protein
LTPPPLPTASGNCSAPSSRPGSPRLTPTVTAGGCNPCRAPSGISRRARISTSSTQRTNLASTRPTRTAPIVVSSRSSGTMTRRTFSTATSTYDPPNYSAVDHELHGSVGLGAGARLISASPERPAQPMAEVTSGTGEQCREQVLDLAAGQADQSGRWWVANASIQRRARNGRAGC